MASGLRIWNSSGRLILDTSSKTGRVPGSILTITGDGTLHSFNVSRASGERLFAHILPVTVGAEAQCHVGGDFAPGNDSDTIYYSVQSGATAYLIYGRY